MRFKLDENFGAWANHLFQKTGHDTRTVADEQLQGSTDQRLYETCRQEERGLVTLDLDFVDVIRFPPARGRGLVIIRCPHTPTLALLKQLISRFLEALEAAETPLDRRLWIVETGRIRVYQPDSRTDR